ncbi:MAG TPA: Rrf2 family transcriptional regulator [Phycisphaerae bacterium]|nr:Rrf2 family transcriptional regulator [Phycisphaerae bacterium]
MLTRTSHYALRALVFLTQHEDDWPVSGVRIAREADIPPKYLSKVLGDLVRSGVLESTPGRTGGFRLHRPAGETMLIDVLSPFEHFGQRECPFGNHLCGDDNPCGAHQAWKHVLTVQQDFLCNTSLRDVAFPAGHAAAHSAKHVLTTD